MTDEGRTRSAVEELARSREEVRISKQILDLGSPRIAATRIYYAVFHAVRALLFSQGLEPRSHAGVQHLFAVHFVQAGKLPPSASRLIARLQKYREEADYGEVYVDDATGTAKDLADAQELISQIEAMISAP